MATTLSGVPLGVATCARRLELLGADAGMAADVECDISWFGPAVMTPEREGTEAIVQALAGLMTVHGLDAGRPRRIGLEIASVASGMLGAQGVMAALVGRARGAAVEPVRTSALQAGLLLMSHYVAAATAGGDQIPTSPGPEPGPPFRTADDRWFEIEVFDPEAWKRFWVELGAGGADLGRAWTSFRGRYYRGDCSFPPGLHEAAARHSLATTAATAEWSGVSLSPVRDYDEVRATPGWSAGHPLITPRSGVQNGMIINPFRTPEPGVGAVAGVGGVGGDGPLAGVRVVEATNRMQGPLAGLLLHMLGADVVKVEPPGGDPGRMVPPYAGDTGSFFACFNRGKSTVELDLSRPAGRAGLLELLDGADAFLHNWRPGKAAQWSLDEAEVAGVHPGLVYATASGWGVLAENERLIGTDFLVQAYTGAGFGLEPSGAPPRPTRVLITDFMGALVTCEGVLGGLWRRQRTGRGVAVETSLLQGAMALQAHVFEAIEAGREEGRQAGRPIWGPLDVPIPVADGWLVATDDGGVAVRTDLSALPNDPVLAGLYTPLPGTARAPRSPWEHGSPEGG